MLRRADAVGRVRQQGRRQARHGVRPPPDQGRPTGLHWIGRQPGYMCNPDSVLDAVSQPRERRAEQGSEG